MGNCALTMKTFSLNNVEEEAYDSLVTTNRKPVIGITANHEGIDMTLRDAYCRQVTAAGGVPVIIPPVSDAAAITSTLDSLDAVILSGGADHNPLWMGEEPSPKLHSINAVRDRAELLLTRMAFNRQMPILGICRGMQTLVIALGGHVAQDISEAHNQVGRGVFVKHSQDADRSEPTHTVRIDADSLLHDLYETESIAVNSFHHQVADRPGDHLRTTATSEDGYIEAVESTEHKSVIGVQWHPEWLGEDGLQLFQWLTARAAEYRCAQKLHDRTLTLDTHCDTPMFFHQGVDFLKRDSKILVDLHKMREGRLDATSMVCYLPQPYTDTNGAPESRKGKPFSELVHFPVDGPKAYADFIFDEIEKIVQRSNGNISIARSADELAANKAAGRKSIMLGIENGLAIESDTSNLEHFRKRGMVYMTLCHNGDNLICDSAKGNASHGGVSQYGEQVIKEMNRLGIMVDLSHAAESSFYDAMEISTTPIVCSHSNCRSLCDHPRNLTDDQLRALAKTGGVAHTTFYPGFLRIAGEADILDAVAHLEHAISIMGIDHVGIGTDFDGDGGVPGMANASECINFTIQLLRRNYSETDIRKIWGGNWLRIMAQVTACR